MRSLTSTTRHGSRRRRSLVAGVVLSASLIAAACGGGGSEGGSGGGGGDDGSDAGTPTPGGTLVYGLEAENDEGWCLPEAQLAISGIQVARSIYDTLTAPNEEGEYVPFLAETVTPNATFDSWDIKLREGVKFHDGTDLTAEVVKNNLDAFRGQYPTRSPLLFIFVFSNIDTVTVKDPLTVTITTKTPWPALPAALYGSGRIGISAQAQLDDAETCDRNLIGTGPFKFESWNQNESFKASKNADYWQKDADGVQLPYLDAIEFQPRPDASSRINGLLSDELQMIHASAGENIDQLRQETEAGTIRSFESEQFPEVSFGQFNTAVEPFNNKNARLAAINAIDMETFNTVRNLDILTNANGPFGPGNMGYLEDTGYETSNLEKAEEYIAAYKEETGKDLEFTLLSTNDETTRASAQLVQEMAQKAGIKVNIRDMSQSELIDNAIAGSFQVMVFRNYPGGDPDTQFNWWTNGSPVNFAKINDDTLTGLMEQGRVSSDKAERTKIYEDVNKRFASEGYSLWLQWTMWDIGMNKNVYGELGPDLPDGGGKPFPGLATGHPVSGIWIKQ